MPNNDYANEPNQSRSEDIIQSILDNTEYDEPARSRIEYLLVELKNAIEGGGGGGGVTSYAPLTEKPKIDNHTLQAGNNTSSDLGLQTKLTFDSTPTESSTNPVTSGGVYTALGAKANSADVYNKSSVDTALSAKADKSTTYTKTEVDTALGSKQNTISDLSTIRSGAALGATAVQPVSGKGLSTNDYTNDEKSKLAGIEAQANKTTVDSALSGTSTNPVQNKVVKSALDGKQATLTTAQLAAVNSGITSTDVEQIETNKNNISYYQANGSYNKLRNSATTQTVSNTTFTVQPDGTVDISGKPSSGNAQIIISDLSELENGKQYTFFNGGTVQESTNIYFGLLGASGVPNLIIPPNGVTITLDKSQYLSAIIRVTSSSPITTANFKPMATDGTISHSYEPYALSNAELTAKEQVNENNILSNARNGVGNYINSADVTISASGYVLNALDCNIPQGDYYLKYTSTQTISGNIQATLKDANNTTVCDTTTTSTSGANLISITLTGTARKITIFSVRAGTYSNLQIVPKTLYDAGFTDYQPYALSNAAITPALQECVDNGKKNYSSITGLSKATTTIGFAGETNFEATIPAGTYVVSYDLTRSDNTKTGVIGFRDVDDVYTGSGYYWTTASHQVQTVTFNKAVKAINMYVAEGTTCTMSNLMIQTIASYNAGFTAYQPYALSNAELTADVASLTAKSQKTISSSGNTSKLRLTLYTSVMSNANRGSLLLSIPFQTSSYDNALLLIAIGDDSFLGVQRLDNSNNSMVTSWALSANNTILDITLRAQPWSAPVAFPLAQVAPPITYSWES